MRAALMGIGINASLDEEDEEEEDVWALEAGRVKTRRCVVRRSARRLPGGGPVGAAVDSLCSSRLSLSQVQVQPPAYLGLCCCMPWPHQTAAACCWCWPLHRTRLLRSLPKLDSSTAQQLTAFLSQVQQHSPKGTGRNTSPAAGAAAGAALNGDGAMAVSEEEQQWWQQASLAYSLLREQAGKVQQGQEQQQQAVVEQQ